jgi:hypothetical protein
MQWLFAMARVRLVSRSRLACWFVLACAGCDDGRAPAPGSIPRGIEGVAKDAGSGDGDGGARDAMTEPPGAKRDAGFSFDGFAVAETRDAAADGAAFEVPVGWRCREALGRDAICDCGCGAPDPACATPGCSAPGCSLPVCEACWGEGGELRDCGAPGAWSCERSRLGDGVCDCGCGAPDPDCEPGEGCYVFGCNVVGCERCRGASADGACGEPAAFTCGDRARENGACDCGCGNLDPECNASSCVSASCWASGCDVCHDAASAEVPCVPPAPVFVCAPAQRGDGACDCGCGAPDPDCQGKGCTEAGCGAAECDLCHDAFGRELPCPGQWTCPPSRFGDGLVCDCGCGRPDPDCRGEGCAGAECDAAACDVRHGQGGAPIQPSTWLCAADDFAAQNGCDCGCGALDPDCAGGCAEPGCRAQGCDRCRAADGSAIPCRWTCELARFDDGAQCDCGCGTFDPDCGGLGCHEPGCFAHGCDRCYASSGSEVLCEPSACSAVVFGDGVCDCGCRVDDVDCAAANDCVEPGCSADGCGRCHDANGDVQSCAAFYCELEQQGGGDGCNCGCGAPDPDCAIGQGCAQPGCIAQGCVTCRGVNGAPMSCAP